MRFVRINGVNLHYRVKGRDGAPPVVLINSLGTDARIWDGVIERLSESYRLISYDKRGHGLSEAPEGDYTVDEHVVDLVGLLDHVGVSSTAVCGVSVGGLIAQRLAIVDPSRVSALILCDTAPKIGNAELWNARIDATRGGMSGLADATMERWFSPRFRAEDPDAVAGWRSMLARCDRQGYVGTCATLRDTDLRDEVGRIAQPTLVIAGSEDKATPPDVVRGCVEAIPDVRFMLMEGVGHIPSVEQPGALAAHMTGFFREIGHD